jgi:hypothetical protein
VSIDTASVREAVTARSPEPAQASGWWTARRVLLVAAALVVVQLVVRGWVAAGGYFLHDDLIASARATQLPLLSRAFLLYDHDGHFMPAAFLLSGLLTKMAPLQWWPFVVGLVLMQAMASIAVWRLLRLLLGDRPIVLLPFGLYLFSPLTLTAFAWWIAGVNALPFQAGLAWVAGNAVLLLRTGRIRYAVTGTLVFAATIVFFEKAVILPVVVLAVAVLLRRQAGDTTPITSALRAGRWLWAGLLVVLAAWVLTYVQVVGSPVIGPGGAGTVPQAIDLIRNGVLRGVVPALVGGPLNWVEIGHWADPPTAMVVLGCVVLLAAVVWSSRRRQGAGVIWWLVAGYVAVNAAAMVAGRLTIMTADVLSLNLRYFADTTLVVVIAIAFIARAPERTDYPQREVLTVGGRRLVVAGVAAAFLVASAWSTVTYQGVWSGSSSRAYLTTAQESLESSDVPVLDQAVPTGVIWVLAHPYNLISNVFSPLGDQVPISTSTSRLQLLDGDGHLVDAELERLRLIEPGPMENCGHGVSSGRTTRVPLDGPLVALPWTVQLNYLAGGNGFIDVSLDGDWVRAPVERGAHTVYITLIGGGENLRVKSPTDGLAVCVDSGGAGFIQPTDS